MALAIAFESWRHCLTLAPGESRSGGYEPNFDGEVQRCRGMFITTGTPNINPCAFDEPCRIATRSHSAVRRGTQTMVSQMMREFLRRVALVVEGRAEVFKTTEAWSFESQIAATSSRQARL